MHRRDFRLLNENLIEPRVDFPQYSVDLSQLLMLSHMDELCQAIRHSYRPLRYNKKPARIENIQHVLLCFKPITCLSRARCRRTPGRPACRGTLQHAVSNLSAMQTVFCPCLFQPARIVPGLDLVHILSRARTLRLHGQVIAACRNVAGTSVPCRRPFNGIILLSMGRR